MGSLYNLRMDHQRAGKVNVEKLKKDTEKYLDAHHEIKDRVSLNEEVPHGENVGLEIVAGVWAFVAENIEREEWKTYTREDWAELERNYVEYAKYTEPDLFDDILTEYEAGRITEEEAQAQAKQHRKCKYRFCENVYKPRRKDQTYCDSNCRKREANAIQRFKQTGTYLPPHVYKDIREDTSRRSYGKMERAFDMEENGEMFARFQHKDEFGGLRDRRREDYYEMNKEIDENVEESPIMRHWIPDTYEERERAVV